MLIWQVFHRFSSYDVAHVVRSESYWVFTYLIARFHIFDCYTFQCMFRCCIRPNPATSLQHAWVYIFIFDLNCFVIHFFDTRDRIGTSIMILFHPYDITERIVVSDTSVIFMTDDLIWENHVISCYVFTI